nr:hypothetical protein [Tanacetum cinerariifolium]
MDSHLNKGEELIRDVVARMAYLKGQGAGNDNKSRANEEVAGTNSATHNNLPSMVLENPKVSCESVIVAKGHNIAFESIWSFGRDGPPLMNYEGLGVIVNSESTQFVQFEINNDDQTNPQTLDAPIIHEASIRVEPVSYVGAASSKQPTSLKGESSNFKFIKVDNVFEGVALSMPRRVVENVSTRFKNTLYGYFIGIRLAFPVVEYFVKNNWSKYDLKRIILNAKGFFFFKFDSRDGLESVLEEGPWMIKNNPIILKQWTMNTSLLEEELNRVPIWVKFYDVSLEIFDEEGISIISSHIGKTIMLDAYTSAMCKDSWGRSSFARCLIEVSSNEPLKDSFTIGIHVLCCLGFTQELIKVEYEWKPLRCDICKIFGHCSNMSSYPKRVVAAPAVVTNTLGVNNNNDGFQQVVNKKRSNKKSFASNKIPKGVPLAKGLQIGKEFNYQPRATSTSANGCGTRSKDSFTAGLSKESNKDHSTGGYETNATMQEFKEYVQAMERKCARNMIDMVSDASNNTFDGNQVPDSFVNHYNQFLRSEDHSTGGYETNATMQEFKEYVQAMEEGFREIMETGWNVNFEGCAMFRVVKMLKGLKNPFRKLLHNHGNLHERVNKIRIELDKAQKSLDRDPSSSTLREDHRKCARNMIDMVSDASNNTFDGNQADFMVRDVSNNEVKSVVFSTGDDRAPGPDGFSAAFFKKA